MRRASGLALGTLAVFAVLLVALSIAAGAFASGAPSAVRTGGGAAGHAELTHAPTVAAATAASGAKAIAPRPAAPHPAAGFNVSNWTLVGVTITPNMTTVHPGDSTVLTATAICDNTTLNNITCDPATNVTFGWAWDSPDLGWLNATNGSSVTFLASWNATGTGMASVTAYFNNSTSYVGIPAAVPAAVTVYTSGMPGISMKYTTTFSLYMPLTFTVNWTLSLTNATVSNTTTWVFLNVRDISGNCGSQFGLGGPCATVVNFSEAVSSGQTAFSQTINYTNLNSTGYAATSGGLFPADEYQFLVWTSVNNSEANLTAAIQQNVYPVFQTPIGSFVAPIPGDDLSTGNVTFAVRYTGYDIQAAALTVVNSGGHVVYVQPMFAPGLVNRTVAATVAWAAVTPGTYTAMLNISTPYGTYTLTQAYTVIAAGQTIYVNHTYQNKSELPGGLSPGVAGALLLTIGLIIGLIVALVLGRMMWGTPSQPASPQPWTPTSGSGGSGDSMGGSGGSGGSGSGGSDTSGGSSGSSGSGDTSGKT